MNSDIPLTSFCISCQRTNLTWIMMWRSHVRALRACVITICARSVQNFEEVYFQTSASCEGPHANINGAFAPPTIFQSKAEAAERPKTKNSSRKTILPTVERARCIIPQFCEDEWVLKLAGPNAAIPCPDHHCSWNQHPKVLHANNMESQTLLWFCPSC